MPKYLILFTLTDEAIARMMELPTDREAELQAVLTSLGGRLEGYYGMTGPYDGCVVVQLPDHSTAAALRFAVQSTGAFVHLEVHELFPASDIVAVMQRARDVYRQHRPPGA